MACRWDKKFKPYTQEYAKNEEKVRGRGVGVSVWMLVCICKPGGAAGSASFHPPSISLPDPHPTHPPPLTPPFTLQFFSDFAAAFAKLLELGVPFPEGSQPV